MKGNVCTVRGLPAQHHLHRLGVYGCQLAKGWTVFGTFFVWGFWFVFDVNNHPYPPSPGTQVLQEPRGAPFECLPSVHLPGCLLLLSAWSPLSHPADNIPALLGKPPSHLSLALCQMRKPTSLTGFRDKHRTQATPGLIWEK